MFQHMHDMAADMAAKLPSLAKTITSGAVAASMFVAALGASAAALANPASAQERAAGLESLSGSGTAADPWQIGSKSDLDAAVSAINANERSSRSATFRLTADIDMNNAAFTGITEFAGTFDGAGHTIANITYGYNADANRYAFIGKLSGTVRDLTLDTVTATNPDTSQDAYGRYVSGLVGNLNDGTLTGNTVRNATLTAPGTEKVAGLVDEVAGTKGSTISGNLVDNATITAYRLPSAVASYAKQKATISGNLVVGAKLAVVKNGGDGGERGTGAGMIVAYPGTPNEGTFAKNAVVSGSIDYTGKRDGFSGRIIGWTGYDGWTADDNIASTDVTISKATVTGPGTKNQDGDDTAPADFAKQTTYEKLGWDFTERWRFDDKAGHPVPNHTYSLAGQGTEGDPYLIATTDDLTYLAAKLNGTSGTDGTSGTEATAGKYAGADKVFALAADLDFAGKPAFQGFDRFEGTLLAQGHTISNIVYTPSAAASAPNANAAAKSVGFVRTLTGRIADLTLDGVTATSTNDGWASALAVTVDGGTVEGVSIKRAKIEAPKGERAAAIADGAQGSATIRNNWVDDAAITAAKMPAGIVSYAKDKTTIEHNLVSARLTDLTDGGANGTRGVDAALVVTYPGNNSNQTTVRGNVAIGGQIDYKGKTAGFAGRIVGYYLESGPYRIGTLADNLASVAITVGGAPVTGGTRTNQNGADATADDLAKRATYEQLGWDFAGAWRFDGTLKHPVPHYTLPGEAPNRITTTFYGDTRTQRAFTWYSTLPAGTVEISTDKAFPRGDSTVTVTADKATSRTGETYYQAVAKNLKAGTTYYYRLGSADDAVWSPVGTFVTSNGDTTPFTFINYTDTQAGNLDEAKLAAATLSKALIAVPDASFAVHNGDFVDNSTDEQYWKDMIDSAQPSLLGTTLAVSAGNHDAAANSFVQHFKFEAPNGQDTTAGAYYSYDYNMAHFAVLNTNESASQDVSDEQIAWLRNDVTEARKRGAQWIIISMHKGLYSTANHASDDDIIAMRPKLMKAIDELDIDLVLEGHDHVMTRTKPLQYADAQDAAGIQSAKVSTPAATYDEIIDGKHIQYNVKPDGTVFLLPNTAGAKHYSQATGSSKFDFEKYLNLFDRTGVQGSANPSSIQNFAAISLSEDRLTVNIYDIRDQGQPRLFEGFGIDRKVPQVEGALAALPKPESVRESDAAAIEAARAAVDALNDGQRSAIGKDALKRLTDDERALQAVRGEVDASGKTVAWAAAGAKSRQTITIRNDERTGFTDAPVRLDFAKTPDVAADSLEFHLTDGTTLPYEVERWTRGGRSTVWVRVPSLPAHSATTIWAYFGANGGNAAGAGNAAAKSANRPTDVWSNGYTLVEHLSDAIEPGKTHVDSTGKARGTLIGEALKPADGGVESAQTGAAGAGADAAQSGIADTGMQFGRSRLQYSGDIGGDYDKFTVSTLFSLTDEQAAAIADRNTPVAVKESATGDGQTTFWQGVKKGRDIGTRMAGNSYEFGNVDINQTTPLPGNDSGSTGNGSAGSASRARLHLVTQTYDGMTYSIFVDGKETHSEMVEYRTTYGDPRVPTTIGDYSSNDGKITANAFPGFIGDVQIAGIAFTPDFEQFRWANYNGANVAYGDVQSRDDASVNLTIGTPSDASAHETGLIEVTGTVDAASTLVATVNGDEMSSTHVNAGDYRIKVPVNATGDNVKLAITATPDGSGAGSGSNGNSAATKPATRTVTLAMSDTRAPNKPTVADNAASVKADGDKATQVKLTATPVTDDKEPVDATFYANASIALDAANTSVRTGTSTDRLPGKLTPDSGKPAAGKDGKPDLTASTTGRNANPYQIVTVKLTAEQAKQSTFHLTWNGTADKRLVSAYVWDAQNRTWLLKDSGSNADGKTVSLDVTATAAEHAVDGDGKLTLLIWRGLNKLPGTTEAELSATPAPADFDWSMEHVPDTQLYTQATPDMFVDQMSYVASVAKERKTAIVIQSGDLVNRPYLSQEYQWKNADLGIAKLAEAGLPFLESWGNHDYSDARNDRVMLPKYWPMGAAGGNAAGSDAEGAAEATANRFADMLKSHPNFTFGGSNSIDNYYYTADIDGAKILFLTVGYWSADNADDEGLTWARGVIESHPDYAVILATHNVVNSGAGRWSNDNVVNALVKPYSNVKLVLGGHIAGTGVTSLTRDDGTVAYGVLTDYQSRVYGGEEYLRHISVDAENGLVYFNTYSPLLNKTSSDGPWSNKGADFSSIPGFQGESTENFVLPIDFGGATERTLTTGGLTLAAGSARRLGTVPTAGSTAAEMTIDGVVPGAAYEWYVELADKSGHVTRSDTRTFTVAKGESGNQGGNQGNGGDQGGNQAATTAMAETTVATTAVSSRAATMVAPTVATKVAAATKVATVAIPAIRVATTATTAASRSAPTRTSTSCTR